MRVVLREATRGILCALACVACGGAASPTQSPIRDQSQGQPFNGYLFITADGIVQEAVNSGAAFSTSQIGPLDITVRIADVSDLKFGVSVLFQQQVLRPLPEPAPGPTISGHWDQVAVGDYRMSVGVYPSEGKPLIGPTTITFRGTIVFH